MAVEEAKIIDLYFARDEQAIKETESKYGKVMYAMAFRILNNHEDAEECVNDTYVGLWNAIPPTRPNSLMAFACKITRNLSLKRFQYLSREKRCADVTTSFDELESVLADERFAPGVSDEEVGKLISQFLRAQKEEVRFAFIRKYFFFDSIKEIAEICSFTESKVKNILFHARNDLKEYLRRNGVEI